MKKNKKLFAILTLVAFMMTLVPALAFAGGPHTSVALSAATYNVDGTLNLTTGSITNDTIYRVAADGKILETVGAAATQKVTPVPGTIYAAVLTSTGAAVGETVTLAGNEFTVPDKASVDAAVELVRVAAANTDAGAFASGQSKAKFDTALASYAALNDASKAAYAETTNGKRILAADKAVKAWDAYVKAPTDDTKLVAFKSAYAMLVNKGDVAAVTEVAADVVKGVAENSVDVAEQILKDAGIIGGDVPPVTPEDPIAENKVAKAASGVYTKTTTADADGDDALEYTVELMGANGKPAANLDSGKLYIWVERADKVVSDIDTITVTTKTGEKTFKGTKAELPSADIPADGMVTVKITSTQAGKVTVKASLVASGSGWKVDENLLTANGSVTGEFSATSTSASKIVFSVDGANNGENDGADKDHPIKGAKANSNNKYEVTATITNSAGQPVKDQKVTISANKSGIDLEKEEAKTDNRGKIDFDVTATKSGTFVVTVVAGSKSEDLYLNFAAADPVTVEITKAPKTTVAVDSEVTFKVAAKDIYGNRISQTDAIKDSGNGASTIAKLGDKETKLQYNATDTATEGNGDIVYNFTPSKVGTYTITFKLDNGKKATTTLEVAEQGKITEMQVNYDADTVRLGAKTGKPEIVQIDAAGVTKTATSANVAFAVTGKGVNAFDSKTGELTVSAEDKYVGEVLTVTAVDKTNNVSATAALTIADAAQSLKFNGTAGVTGQDTNITFNVVDASGNKVALGSNVTIKNATAVVTSKPDGANATAVINKSNDLKDTGVAILQVNTNKDGVVKVQVMVEVEYPKVGTVDLHTEYYTGVAEVTFGDKATVEGAGSTATMIMGSTTFVANGKVVTSDVAPFVKDGRTFLPIRALGEALGAEVSFDEATNVVTIKLDGKTVTMTLGSAVMTVGDKVVTMDTAAYATAEGRTVVPVRFAAEALGFNVEAVYATDGTTSAVNFSK